MSVAKVVTFLFLKHSMKSSGRVEMAREDCGCQGKGRLIVYVESEIAQRVRIELIEENKYRDVYIITLKNGKGNFRVEGISMGTLTLLSDIDGENVVYYPGHKILFEKNNYVHKVSIIDRRKIDAL